MQQQKSQRIVGRKQLLAGRVIGQQDGAGDRSHRKWAAEGSRSESENRVQAGVKKGNPIIVEDVERGAGKQLKK